MYFFIFIIHQEVIGLLLIDIIKFISKIKGRKVGSWADI